MKTIKLTTLGLSLAVVAMSLGATSAQAGCSKGFIADLACRAGVINKQTANGLDAVHAGIGRPLDRMAPAIGGMVAGPVGAGIGTVWQQQDQLRRQAEQSQRFIGGYNQSGGYQGGGYRPVSQSLPMPSESAFGTFCATQYGAAAMAPSPVGYRCLVPTNYGPVEGIVVQ